MDSEKVLYCLPYTISYIAPAEAVSWDNPIHKFSVRQEDILGTNVTTIFVASYNSPMVITNGVTNTGLLYDHPKGSAASSYRASYQGYSPSETERHFVFCKHFMVSKSGVVSPFISSGTRTSYGPENSRTGGLIFKYSQKDDEFIHYRITARCYDEGMRFNLYRFIMLATKKD